MTIADLFDKGGPVVWVLAAYSVLGLGIVLDRYLHFLRMGRAPVALPERVRAGDPAALDGLKGPEVAVIRGMLAAARDGVENLSLVAARLHAAELQRMESGFRTLGVLANTAPLLGLFGTITGMIKAFMVIEQAGGKVDAQALAGGIWEAMITTGVGLAVAIPLLILLHFLEGAAERRALAMQRSAALVMERRRGAPPALAAADPVHHWEGLTDAL